MSEIEKMYNNAGVEPIYPYTKCYPEFTAEKQLELIKWLNLNDKIDCFLSRHNELRNEWVLSAHCVTEFANEKPFIYPGFNKEFSQALAMLINYLWQDLTEEEKQQIKEILNG